MSLSHLYRTFFIRIVFIVEDMTIPTLQELLPYRVFVIVVHLNKMGKWTTEKTHQTECITTNRIAKSFLLGASMVKKLHRVITHLAERIASGWTLISWSCRMRKYNYSFNWIPLIMERTPQIMSCVTIYRRSMTYHEVKVQWQLGQLKLWRFLFGLDYSWNTADFFSIVIQLRAYTFVRELVWQFLPHMNRYDIPKVIQLLLVN